MQRTIRIATVAVAIAATAIFLVPSDASAQVRVEGRFRLPHGDIAIGVGDPYYGRPWGYHRYPVGSYVPYGHRVYRRARYGYGFHSPAFACRSHGVRHAHWVPVRRVRSRWVVVSQPVVVQEVYEEPYYGGYDDGYYDDRYYERRRPRYRRDLGATLFLYLVIAGGAGFFGARSFARVRPLEFPITRDELRKDLDAVSARASDVEDVPASPDMLAAERASVPPEEPREEEEVVELEEREPENLEQRFRAGSE